MKRKNLLIMIFVITSIMMLLGSSYSLIMNEFNPDYDFVIKEMNKEYLDNYKINIKENEIEISVSVINKTINKINYRLDLVNNVNQEENKNITYSYSLNEKKVNCNLYDNTTIMQNKTLDINESDNYQIKIHSASTNRISLSLNLQASNDKDKYLVNTISENNSFNADQYQYNNENNNYVYFNCFDDKCERWRILGIFDKKNSNSYNTLPSIKLVKDTPIDKINYNNEDLEGDYDKSYINTYLNGIYYDNLSESSKKLIINTNWNIGEIKNVLSSEDERQKKFITRIGLINVSDYLSLKDNSWLKLDNGLLLNKMNNHVLVYDNVLKEGDNFKEYNIYPSVYIRGDVSNIMGDGSFDNPYVLDIIYPLNYGVSDDLS